VLLRKRSVAAQQGQRCWRHRCPVSYAVSAMLPAARTQAARAAAREDALRAHPSTRA
jgi:hypothetical protein